MAEDGCATQCVVSKWAALNDSIPRALAPLEAKVVSGNQRYAKGKRVEIAAEGANSASTLFNLPPEAASSFSSDKPRMPQVL